MADAEARARIVAERQRNVCVMAGAGTGKTTAIVQRMVSMLAPEDDALEAVSIDSVAAITFTRKAAGELRFKIRESLLREVGRDGLTSLREARVRRALAGLDVAFVGTIHSFADRLLRRRPTEAQLSPAYELVEDIEPLVAEVLRQLLRAVERGALEQALGAWADQLPAGAIADAISAVEAAQRAGISLEKRPGKTWGDLPSLQRLLRLFIETRDAVPEKVDIPDPELDALREVGHAIIAAIGRLAPQPVPSAGRRWLDQVSKRLVGVGDDPAGAVALVQEVVTRKLRARHFEGEGAAHALYKRLTNRRGQWFAQIGGPHHWLGATLAKSAPVAVALYEQLRADRQAVDFLDVLIRLRALLRDHREIRLEFQGVFEHIFVDEFQDTDPLQCEIIFYLCEAGAVASTWEEIEIAPGRLTLVGDPQQSIYRFRRADITSYLEAMDRLQSSGALFEKLTTNFRSTPSLVSWFNEAMPAMLGQSRGPRAPLQLTRDGRVPFEPLEASEETPELEGSKSVLLLNYVGEGHRPLRPWGGRAVEAKALGLLLQNLVAPDSKLRIRDMEAGHWRSIRPSDVAVLTESMSDVPLLLEELDRLGLRSTVRGGRLMMDHPLVREMLLGYCALCDPLDGVAVAALMRPPFFPLSEEAGLDAQSVLWGACLDTVDRLREHREDRSPGALMRDLIEGTGLCHTLLLEVNGPGLLQACYEVALELDRRAFTGRLDAGAAAALARSWAMDPIPLTAPEPTGHDAIRVLTTYQAKGMEFPVVVLWDGFRGLKYSHEPDWLVARDGRSWMMRLGDMVFGQPRGSRLLSRERQIRSRERERLAYVAATRARDLLVIPLPQRDYVPRDRNRVLATASSQVQRLPYVDTQTPGWHRAGPASSLPEAVPDLELATDLMLQNIDDDILRAEAEKETRVYSMTAAARELAQQESPESAWACVRQLDLEEEGLEDVASGSVGAAVKAALGLVVEGAVEVDAAAASARSAAAFEVSQHSVFIADQVQKSLDALRDRGLFGEDEIRCGVPIAVYEEGPDRLLTGRVDMLCRRGEEHWIVNLNTAPPPLNLALVRRSHPEVVVELQMAERALGAQVGAAGIKLAVLFTRSGALVEVT